MSDDVFDTRKSVMMRLRHLVSKGYIFYSQGSCRSRDMNKLRAKFEDRYQVDANRGVRYRRGQKGQANAFLVFWKTRDSEVHFWLLATEGEGLIFEVEAMKDATKKTQRLMLPTLDFVLLRAPRKGDKVRWSWKIDEAVYKEWRSAIQRCIRQRDEQSLRQWHHRLVRTPGFSASRKQAFALLKFMENEWKRTRKDTDVFPFSGSYVGWIGRF